ncbi:MAG TPA: bifunctional phosphoribosylaminoimidazolecarboxamide formyltransferase/IMP cyclohydrolase [Patescibacteria group bacterium]|nr:bifunctional phosphoribosylaminoimidazolecarboxamide formyltransferase/IMP cyclohydrolase [Patescibacteria group bacterium]
MKCEEYKIKRALISVSDKTDIVDFARGLHELGIELISTGGTADFLRACGLDITNVSDLTGFPEILDGRVKTLHPKIHAGLLAQLDNEAHQKQLLEHDFPSIDLLVVNLYPFEETLAREGSTHEDIVENIDIGGPAMLRAAAKNYRWTAAVVNPQHYKETLTLLQMNDGCLPERVRIGLAGEAFEHTAHYDAVVAEYFRTHRNSAFPELYTLQARRGKTLRYGENPHQSAVLYGKFTQIFNQLHGKELSYNNIIDIDAASRLVMEFNEPAVAIIKHTNPCGVGIGSELREAYNKAFATDTVSPFGGIIAFNKPVDEDLAQMIHGIFTEVLIAPEFEPAALELLKKKKDRRLIQVDYNVLRKAIKHDIRSVAGGYLVQNPDDVLLDEDALRVVTQRDPSEDERAAMLFAWKVAKHVKSNAIVYAAPDRTLAIGAGQMSRVDSARIAVQKAKDAGIDLKGCAVASDAFFPFADGLLQAVEAGAVAVIQPGGSVRDEEVIAAADEHNITMMFTGMRHFRH